MMPILYDSNEVVFSNNGICRLPDCLSCVVTEELNGIYECDFEYPISGAYYDQITCGRIIACRHDDTDDIQPFDIVSYSRPINGIVSFHAVHVSYRQTELVVKGTNINSLSDAFILLKTATPSNPFTYETDISGAGYMAAADGVPRTVRQMLGGVEGSILDAYGGEYEWDRFTVKLWSNRGEYKDVTIRYGLNMIDFKEDSDYFGTYTSAVPYWSGDDGEGGQITVVGDRVDSGLFSVSGRNICFPVDLTDKFETQPTKAELQAYVLTLMQQKSVNLPQQNITVDFLQDNNSTATLSKCKLCDSVQVIFSRYNIQRRFKIVKTVFDVLKGRYESFELGALSTSLSEALGITEGNNGAQGGEIWKKIYPIGAIYMSTVSTSPAELFGGTWERIQARFLLASGTTYAGGATGGEATHTLTSAESGLPNHGHGFTQPTISSHSHKMTNDTYVVTTSATEGISRGNATSGSNLTYVVRSPGGALNRAGNTTQNAQPTATGGAVINHQGASASQAHNNMPPYLAVYVWKRTA